jgi:pimeloyl-ACP methyl ester carboxylesterase
VPAFTEERFDVNGVDTAVLSAGDGPPLVFFHGGGTVTGQDALLPLADSFRLVVPFHPGYGASADDPEVDDIHDYVRHYLDLFDLLGLDEFVLAGHSMGGYLAATFAIYQTARVTRLALAAPIGLRVREHPTVDIFGLEDEDLFRMVTEDPSVFEGKVPMPPTPEFLAERYRESTSTARIFWSRPYDVKLPRWLHRLTMPTLLLWGEKDQLVPVEQAAVWAGLLPNAEVRTLPGVGHLLFDETPAAVDAILAFASA